MSATKPKTTSKPQTAATATAAAVAAPSASTAQKAGAATPAKATANTKPSEADIAFSDVTSTLSFMAEFKKALTQQKGPVATAADAAAAPIAVVDQDPVGTESDDDDGTGGETFVGPPTSPTKTQKVKKEKEAKDSKKSKKEERVSTYLTDNVKKTGLNTVSEIGVLHFTTPDTTGKFYRTLKEEAKSLTFKFKVYQTGQTLNPGDALETFVDAQFIRKLFTTNDKELVVSRCWIPWSSKAVFLRDETIPIEGVSIQELGTLEPDKLYCGKGSEKASKLKKNKTTLVKPGFMTIRKSFASMYNSWVRAEEPSSRTLSSEHKISDPSAPVKPKKTVDVASDNSKDSDETDEGAESPKKKSTKKKGKPAADKKDVSSKSPSPAIKPTKKDHPPPPLVIDISNTGALGSKSPSKKRKTIKTEAEVDKETATVTNLVSDDESTTDSKRASVAVHKESSDDTTSYDPKPWSKASGIPKPKTLEDLVETAPASMLEVDGAGIPVAPTTETETEEPMNTDL